LRENAFRIAAHGVQWRVAEAFAPILPLVEVGAIRHPERLNAACVVKDNPVRTVARFPDPRDAEAPGYYVKRYKLASLRRRLKHLFLPSRVRREWRLSRCLRQDGIAACEVIAIAERRKGLLPAEAFLISREVAGAVHLGDFLASEGGSPSGRERAELVAELARLTAQFVRAGYCHHDYHAENVLIRPSAPSGDRFFILDLHMVERRRRVSRRKILAMLGMLGRSAAEKGAAPTDRLRFLRAFLDDHYGTCGRRLLRGWHRRLQRVMRRQHEVHIHSRTRRCVVESSLFTKERAGGYRIFRRRDFPVESALRAIKLHQGAMANQGDADEVRKRGERNEVTLCVVDGIPPYGVGQPVGPERLERGPVCVKSFLRRTLAARIKDQLRPRSRAKHAWIALRGFEVRGLPAARPLALLESGWKLSGRPDYLVMEGLEGACTLHDLVSQWTGKAPEIGKRRKLAGAIAGLLRLLAEERTWHPDTKPTNLLVRESGDDYQLYLVDMARIRFGATPDRLRWARWLAQLNAGLPRQVTLLDRLRCLRACGRGQWSGRERKEIARMVYRASLARRPLWLR